MSRRSDPGGSLAARLNVRLLSVYAATLLLALLGLGVSGLSTGVLEHRHGLQAAARAVAEQVLAGAEPDAMRREGPTADFAREFGGFGFAVWDAATGERLAASPPGLVRQLDSGSLPSLMGANGAPRADLLRTEAAGRAVVVGFFWDGQDIWSVAHWMADELRDEFLPLIVPMALSTLVIVPLTVRRALRPLEKAARRLPRDADGAPVPYPVDGLPRELRPFVEAANDAIARLAATVQQQRRFTADAAHALRTPLTALRLRLDTMPPSPQRDALTATALRLSRLVEQLLEHARLSGDAPLATEPGVDLLAIARDVADRMAPVAQAAGVAIVVADRGATPVTGAPEVIGDALEALLDNALRVSPAGAQVEIVAGPGPLLEVRDRGPGLAEPERERVFAPFARGAEAAYAGTGLGLATVRETMRRHGGSAALLPRQGGGLAARMDFRRTVEEPDAALPVQRVAGLA